MLWGGFGEGLGVCGVPDGLCVFPAPSQASVVSERDYESLVMMRMRQAAERQQLIEQLQREDEEEKSHT